MKVTYQGKVIRNQSQKPQSVLGKERGKNKNRDGIGLKTGK